MMGINNSQRYIESIKWIRTHLGQPILVTTLFVRSLSIERLSKHWPAGSKNCLSLILGKFSWDFLS